MDVFVNELINIKHKLWNNEINKDEAIILVEKIKLDIEGIIEKGKITEQEFLIIDMFNYMPLPSGYKKEIYFIEAYALYDDLLQIILNLFQTKCEEYIATMKEYIAYDHFNLEIEVFEKKLVNFMNRNLFIIKYLKENNMDTEIVSVIDEYNNHFDLIAKNNIEKIFDKTLSLIKDLKFTSDINIIYNDIELLITQPMPKENTWYVKHIANYHEKVQKIATTIMSKIKEMNTKFVLTQSMYDEKLRIFCEETSTSDILNQMFAKNLSRKMYDLQQIPFCTDYNQDFSKYEMIGNFTDGTKNGICLHNIRNICQYMSRIKDFYTYTVSFDISNSNFIHVVEDNNIEYGIEIYFSDLYEVNEKTSNENKITHRNVSKQILSNEHFSHFYFVYTAFMTEYLQVKKISLTMSEAIDHSSENNFSMVTFNNEFKLFPIINDLQIRELNAENIFISNDVYIVEILNNLCKYVGYKSNFVNKELLQLERYDNNDNDYKTIQEYDLNINKIKHRLFLEFYIRIIMHNDYHDRDLDSGLFTTAI